MDKIKLTSPNSQAYVCLLRGINVGGKNKVPMSDLKNQFSSAGFTDVRSYINSGNILFSSEAPIYAIHTSIAQLLQTHYTFSIPFALISGTDYLHEISTLPDWWQQPIARRDVLFYTKETDVESLKERISKLTLHDEVVYFGNIALFWGKHTESEFLKTSYHKYFIKDPAYKTTTIRNGNTFEKISELLQEK